MVEGIALILPPSLSELVLLPGIGASPFPLVFCQRIKAQFVVNGLKMNQLYLLLVSTSANLFLQPFTMRFVLFS